MRRTLAAVAAALAVLCLCTATAAQEHHQHPPGDADAHSLFYQHLTRPDIQGSYPGSCCSGMDCYSTPARFSEGQWWALRREDRVWIAIPPERIVTREDELARRPTYEATLCAQGPAGGFVYCFVPPEGGV